MRLLYTQILLFQRGIITSSFWFGRSIWVGVSWYLRLRFLCWRCIWRGLIVVTITGSKGLFRGWWGGSGFFGAFFGGIGMNLFFFFERNEKVHWKGRHKFTYCRFFWFFFLFLGNGKRWGRWWVAFIIGDDDIFADKLGIFWFAD